jgi:hypothetical protein
MRAHQFIIRESAPQGLVAFRARILAAVPGKSLNGRIYTRELLKQTAPLYPSSGVNPRPFTLDHDIEHSERVVGMITGARYDVEEAMNGDQIEGLWLDAIGYMEENLFKKVVGSKIVPPFIRGVSIGGEGEGEWTGNGVLIRNFKPAELALTPFPGIPTAHIAAINLIREHYLNSNSEVKNTTIQIRENDLSLEDAEKQAANDTKNPRKIREGPLPSPDQGINDARPGLPRPTVRTNVLHIQPQATTSADSGFRLNPEDNTSSMNRAMTASGTNSQRGRTGMPTEVAAPGPSTAGSPGRSKDARTNKIKIPKTGNTTTTSPGPGNQTPSGTGMDSEDEEESMQDMGSQDHPLPKKTDRSLQKNPMMSKPGSNPHAKDGEEEEEEESARSKKVSEEEEEEEEELDGMPSKNEEEEEEEEEEERQHPRRIKQHGPSPHIPGKPIGKQGSKPNPATGSKGDAHQAGNPYDSPSDQPSEEEEEEARKLAGRLTQIYPGYKVTMQRIKQDDEPVGVTPGAKPGTDSSDDRPEEEEEDGVSVDPVRKVAGQGQNINANPTKEEKGPQVLFSEAEPIQARAFSLPTNAGILATLSQLAAPEQAKQAMEQGGVEELVKSLTRPNHTMSRENVAQLIEAWNRGKMPKEEAPRKIIIRKPGIGSSKDVSIPDARPVPEIAESVVKTRSVTNIAPTMAATSVSTLPTSRLDDLLSEEKKRPYSNVSYLNAAKRAWNRAVQELIQFQ